MPRSVVGRGMLIFALGLLVRLLIAALKHSWADLDRAEMELEAISLAHTGVLGNPYSLPTGPSAHVCPAYALLLASIFYAFGTGETAEFVKVLLTCLISSCQYALLPWLGKALKLSPGVGFAAGLFGAIVPLYPYIEIQGDFENHVTALLLLLLIVWTELVTSRPWTVREALALGAFLGITILTSSTLAPLCLLALAYIGFEQSRTAHGKPFAAALALAAMLLCIAPWAVRNLVQLGSPIATRSNFGMELFLANNDRAFPLMDDNWRLYGCCHPMMNPDEARKIQQQGEVAYNKRLLNTTIKWIKSHPERFGQLTLQHVWLTWVPFAPELIRRVVFRLMTPLSFIGLLLIWRVRHKSALLLAVPLLIYPLPYYLLQVHLRYRYPTEFILLISASATGIAAWKLVADRAVRGRQFRGSV